MAGYERNTTADLVVFAFDVVTGVAKTGDAANLQMYYLEKGGSLTQLTDTTFTEISATNAKGMYQVDLAAGEIDTQYTYFFPQSSTTSPNDVAVIWYRPGFTVPAGFYNETNAAAARVTTALPNAAPSTASGLPTYGDLSGIIITGTINDASPLAGDFDLSSGFSDTPGLYDGMWCVLLTGALRGLARKISVHGTARNISFTGSAGDADAPFPSNPANGDGVGLIGFHGA